MRSSCSGQRASSRTKATRRSPSRRAGSSRSPASTLYDSGGVDEALAAAATRVDNLFTCGFVSHATLEPHNCTADFRDGEVWIRGPLQMPGSGRTVVARAARHPARARARAVHAHRRRLRTTAAVRLRRGSRGGLARDRRAGADRRHAHGRSAARLLPADGDPAAARGPRRVGPHRRLGSRHRQRVAKRVSTRSAAAVLDRDVRLVHRSLPGHSSRWIRISCRRGSRTRGFATARSRTGVPTGAWRAPSHVAIAFAIESTIDELASMARRSAVDMRLEMLGETADVPKNADGADAVRSVAHGARHPGRGRARRLRRAPGDRPRAWIRRALHLRRPTARRSSSCRWTKRSDVVIHKVTAVVDVGQPVNLSGLEAQVEGAIIDGIGAAFFGDVPIERGPCDVDELRRLPADSQPRSAGGDRGRDPAEHDRARPASARSASPRSRRRSRMPSRLQQATASVRCPSCESGYDLAPSRL